MNPDIARVWECREAVPRPTRCSWADCTQPATTTVEDWPCCPSHERDLTAFHPDNDKPDPDPSNPMRHRVIALHAQGMTDREMAATIGCDRSTVRWHRENSGLPINPDRAVAPCGTRAAAQRHKSRCEEMCLPCRRADAEYQAAYKRKRRAAHAVDAGGRKVAS